MIHSLLWKVIIVALLVGQLVPEVSKSRPLGKTKTHPPASRHTPHYSWDHRGSSDRRCMGPRQHPMSHDWAGGQQAFTSDDMESSSALSAGRIWGLGGSHADMSFSGCQISGRHSLHCRRRDALTGSGLWEEAAPLWTRSLSEDLQLKKRWNGNPPLGLEELRAPPSSGGRPHRGGQGATLPSADQTAGIQAVTSAQPVVDRQVSVCDNCTRGQNPQYVRIWFKRRMIPVFISTFFPFHSVTKTDTTLERKLL